MDYSTTELILQYRTSEPFTRTQFYKELHIRAREDNDQEASLFLAEENQAKWNAIRDLL